MDTLKRVLPQKTRGFCEHSTLHGVYYLQRGRCARAAWGAIIVAGVALWTVLSNMIWQKYSIDPTVTVVESTYYRSEQIPFPAVLICDPQPVYGPKASNISHILASRGYDGSQIDDFYASFLGILNTSFEIQPHVRKMHSILQDLGMDVEVLLEKLKKPCDVMLVRCSWRSKRYKCSDMFYEVATVIGHCCHFDIAYFRKSAPQDTTFAPGITGIQGLQVTLDGAKITPNGVSKEGTLSLYIFDATTAVTMMDSPISLDPATFFDVDLEIFAIDSSSDVKALPLRTRKCVLPTDRGLGASFYQQCIATLMMRQIVDYCRCLPFKYDAHDLSTEDYPKCTFERYKCIYSKLDMSYADMHSFIRANNCYQNCDYMEYDSRIDYVRQRTIGNKNDSLTRLAIHYASSTCMKYRRELIYTWDQMLANLGGIFGLCLGGSIISIIEIIWFLVDVIAACLFDTKVKPTRKKVAFVVEKDISKNSQNKDGCYKFVN